MRVLIATVHVPFVRGGAEILAEGLCHALIAQGHEAEVAAIPFQSCPPERILDQMLACRLLDMAVISGMRVDRVIGLKFPAYLIRHPHKVLWIIHQHREAYDLWEYPHADLIRHPKGAPIRDAIQLADQRLIPEAKAVFTIAVNVTQRLKTYCQIDSTPLYHPPQYAERFYCAGAEDYLFFPSRLTPLKRQALVLEALARTRHSVRLRFAGRADCRPYEEELKALARTLRVHPRIDWLGPLSEEEKRHHYAHALAVVYPPMDEDYGYVTLEAMLAAKPVLTCTDSGEPVEFVHTGETGLVAEPTPDALAAAMDQLWDNRAQARMWGEAGRSQYDNRGISWAKVVQRLLS